MKKIMPLTALATGFLLISAGAVAPASASPAPPNGSNLGFIFVGEIDPVLDATAVFLQDNGSQLESCGDESQPCHFDFTYKINGTTDQEARLSGAPSFGTWPEITDANRNDDFCGESGENGPLTNFNCFNGNGFGQYFAPTRSGSFSGFTMAMTCLSPSGRLAVGANLYEVDREVGTIGVNPIATADFTLTGCDNSWSAKEFTAADFTRPTINFGNVSLTSGQGYVVLFSGDAIAGTQPTGSVTPTEAPTLANTGGETNPWLWISGAVLMLLGALGIRKSSKLS